MPIALECPCGKKLRVKDDLAGRKIRCPECKDTVVVPAPEVEPEPEEAVAETYLTETKPSKSKSSTSDDDDDSGKVTAKSPWDKPKKRDRDEDDDEEQEEERPKKRRPRRERPRYTGSSSSRGGYSGLSVSGSIIAGIIMMLIAVIWFVAGLAAGWIYFYPIFLFAFGIAAVVKGITGNAD